jgi:hypothetical protein
MCAQCSIRVGLRSYHYCSVRAVPLCGLILILGLVYGVCLWKLVMLASGVVVCLLSACPWGGGIVAHGDR